ncbi:response regulator [Acetivibrio clariflavus]|uniref:response regulator transcription factor n=1 Tax=Acetivibrio clariflavus TaxID=288965 RepID=UPI0031F4F121
MIKVLIVDDEKNVRDDLATLINWEEHDFKIVGFASNGKQALEIFNNTNPDLVITDIVMPVMDGIELSRKIFEINKNVVIVWLTAYKDSDYAIEAVNIRVSKYLLKYALDADSLIKALSELKKEIIAMHLEQDLVNQIYLKQLLDAPEDEEIVKFYLQELGAPIEKSSYCIIALSLDKYINQDDSSHSNGYSYIKNKVFEEIKKIFGSDNKCFYVEKSTNLFYIFCCFTDTNGEYQIRQKVYTVCKSLQQAVNSSKNETISIGISDIFYSPKLIQKFYMQSKSRLDQCFFEGCNSIIHEDRKIDASYKNDRAKLPSVLQTIYNRLSERESIDVNQCLKPAFLSFDNKQEVKLFSIEIINSTKKLLDDNRIDHRVILGEFVLPDSKFESFRNVNEYLNWFDSLFSNIKHYLLERDKIYSEKIKKTIDYISKNYGRPIDLDNIAEELGITKVYFCYLFKKEMGTNFISYLNNYRIDKAKKLLKCTDLRIGEIANSVGFESSQYFSLLFKKITGETPGDFRKSSKS